MKKLFLVSFVIASALLLSSCGKSAKDLTLAETNLPENQKLVLEGLTPEERKLIQSYVVSRAMRGGVDYTVKVKDALEEQKKLNKAVNSIQ